MTGQWRFFSKAALDPVQLPDWGATIILSGITTIILAGGEESKAA